MFKTCGNCKYYMENYEFNTLSDKCSKSNRFVDRFEMRQCFTPKESKLRPANEDLVPIDSKPYKHYLVWLSHTSNIKVSIEQKCKNQDDIEMIMDYIEERYGICKMRIISLDNIEEVKF